MCICHIVLEQKCIRFVQLSNCYCCKRVDLDHLDNWCTRYSNFFIWNGCLFTCIYLQGVL